MIANVQLRSFGYLHGGPYIEADLIIDLRELLYNPHENSAMRELTGLDEVVREHVITTDGAAKLIYAMTNCIACIVNLKQTDSLPTFVEIGCSGGRHRSVVITNEVAYLLSGMGIQPYIIHRDIHQPVVQR